MLPTVRSRYARAAWRESYNSASSILEFTGIHTMPPDIAVVPPMSEDFSRRSTRRSCEAATAAVVMPPAPAPSTITSYSDASSFSASRLSGVIRDRGGHDKEDQIDEAAIGDRM